MLIKCRQDLSFRSERETKKRASSFTTWSCKVPFFASRGKLNYSKRVRINSGGSTTFHRADLQQTLVSRMSGRLHLGHRFMSLEEKGDEVIMHFQNGTIATCDLLIGMDGIKSSVRKSLLLKQGLSNSPSMEPVWSGTIAYRGLVSRDVLDTVFPGHRAITTPMMYVGKGRVKLFSTFPVKDTHLILPARRRIRHFTQSRQCRCIRYLS